MESAGGWSTDEAQEQRMDMHPVLNEPKHRTDPSEVDEQQHTAFSTEVDIGSPDSGDSSDGSERPRANGSMRP